MTYNVFSGKLNPTESINLANTTESSICGDNAVCCQITLTTCLKLLDSDTNLHITNCQLLPRLLTHADNAAQWSNSVF